MKRVEFFTLLLKSILIGFLLMVGCYTLWYAVDWRTAPYQREIALGALALFAVWLMTYQAPLPLLKRFTHSAWLALVILIACVLTLTLIVAERQGGGFTFAVLAFVMGMILGVAWLVRHPTRESLINLTISTLAIMMSLAFLNALAPRLTASVVAIRQQKLIQSAAPPLDAATLAHSAQSPNLATGSPQMEVLVEGNGAFWGELTGWGTLTNARLRYRLEGVYDSLVEYNALGFRGEALPYEKPDDVFRIMLTGDSFIEAREVGYADTVYAQLNQLVANDTRADGKRVEVFGVGATGWGTLQRYLYYIHEGYRFSPDVVIDLFIINDVADNNPPVFYPSRALDFIVTDTQVQLIREGVAVLEPSFDAPKRWFAYLPDWLKQNALVGFLQEMLAPEARPITLNADQTRLHPQTYIYVASPEIEGYPEGWRRTAQVYALWNARLKADGGQLMVLNVDISAERITELSTYFPDQQQGWVWDINLPTQRLTDILTPLGIPLINTRQPYKEYADALGKRPFDALFYVEDGHWNPQGHALSAEIIHEALYQNGILIPSNP